MSTLGDRARVREAKRFIGSLFTFGPPEADHWAALRVFIGVAAPSLLLIALGRPDLLIYAVFGAFVGMYGRRERERARFTHQAQAATMLVTAVGIGVLLSVNNAPDWLLVVVECTFAGVASLYADRLGLRPNGPFFGLFALGACASVPTNAHALVAVAITAGTAAFALVVGAARWSRPSGWGRTPRELPERVPLGLNAMSYVLGMGIAGGLSVALGIGHPHWAMAAAAVPLAVAGLSHRILRGTHRILGTMVGLGVTAAILLADGLGNAPILLAVIVIALQFPTELFMTRNYGLAMVFFTPLILIMTQLADPADPVQLLGDRAIETLAGAVIGMLVAVALRPRREVEP